VTPLESRRTEVDETRAARFLSNVCSAAAMAFGTSRLADRAPSWPLRGRLVLGAIVAVVVLTATVMLLDIQSVTGARQLPAFTIQIFQVITDLGLSGWFLFPTAIILLLLNVADAPGLPRIPRGVLAAISFRVGFVFMAIAVPGLAVAIIKRLIGRARPFVAGDDPWTSLWLGWRPDYASFPSGHATTAFAAAVAIGALWPALRPVMWTYAVAVAVSRVVVTAHHPSDVIAGAIFGTIGALLVRNWYARRRLGFAVLADGAVLRMPGPSWRRIKAVARRAVSA
jgi:membrane-associated phospholipid phosphatase